MNLFQGATKKKNRASRQTEMSAAVLADHTTLPASNVQQILFFIAKFQREGHIHHLCDLLAPAMMNWDLDNGTGGYTYWMFQSRQEPVDSYGQFLTIKLPIPAKDGQFLVIMPYSSPTQELRNGSVTMQPGLVADDTTDENKTGGDRSGGFPVSLALLSGSSRQKEEQEDERRRTSSSSSSTASSVEGLIVQQLNQTLTLIESQLEEKEEEVELLKKNFEEDKEKLQLQHEVTIEELKKELERERVAFHLQIRSSGQDPHSHNDNSRINSQVNDTTNGTTVSNHESISQSEDRSNVDARKKALQHMENIIELREEIDHQNKTIVDFMTKCDKLETEKIGLQKQIKELEALTGDESKLKSYKADLLREAQTEAENRAKKAISAEQEKLELGMKELEYQRHQFREFVDKFKQEQLAKIKAASSNTEGRNNNSDTNEKSPADPLPSQDGMGVLDYHQHQEDKDQQQTIQLSVANSPNESVFSTDNHASRSSGNPQPSPSSQQQNTKDLNLLPHTTTSTTTVGVSYSGERLDFSDMEPEELMGVIPDYGKPFGELAQSSFFNPRMMLLVRKVYRLTSKRSWEPRVLIVQSNEKLIVTDGSKEVKRAIPMQQITSIQILTHWECFVMVILVRGEQDLVVKLHESCPQNFRLSHFAALIQYFAPHVLIFKESLNDENEKRIRLKDVMLSRNFNLKKVV